MALTFESLHNISGLNRKEIDECHTFGEKTTCRKPPKSGLVNEKTGLIGLLRHRQGMNRRSSYSLHRIEINYMENSRRSLWLILLSQILIMVSGLIEPPSSLVMISIRIVVPLLIVAYISLMLAGYIPIRKR